MNKPETRITLSLKPKAVAGSDSGTTKKVATAAPAEPLPPGVDAALA